MTRTLTLAAAALALAAPAFANPADIVARHAADNDEQRVVSFIAQGGFDGGYTTFGTTGDSPSVSALEVALRHAVENDDEQRARHLRSRIEQNTQDGAARVSSKASPRVSAAEVALRHAVENDDEQLARFLRAQIAQ